MYEVSAQRDSPIANLRYPLTARIRALIKVDREISRFLPLRIIAGEFTALSRYLDWPKRSYMLSRKMVTDER